MSLHLDCSCYLLTPHLQGQWGQPGPELRAAVDGERGAGLRLLHLLPGHGQELEAGEGGRHAEGGGGEEQARR